VSADLRQLLLEELTDTQREVVEQRGHGPIKVAAAAGSGKTKTMATLYAMAVLDGIHPSRILAVTFTDRAAAELRQRIVSTLAGAGAPVPGPFDAPLEGAWVGTFHHLARRLLSEQAYRAELPNDLTLLDEVDARMLLGEAAEAVRLRLAARQGLGRWIPSDPDARTLLGLADSAVGAVCRLRSTELDPADCRRTSLQAYRNFETLECDPEAELAWHRCALEVTLAVWDEFERRLVTQRSLDFDGLLRQALRALRASRALASWCHSNFRLMIVDEYQDTSAVQSALLDEMTGKQAQKLFVVGDARQSIFAFRDAKPGIMAQAPGRSFALFRNHRSLEPILTAADTIIRADPQFADDQPMEVGRTDVEGTPVLLGMAATPDEEAEGIAKLLDAVKRDGLRRPEGSHQEVGFGDMAVLARTFIRLGPPLEEALRRHHIPFQTAVGGLFDRPEVKDALALLRVVADGTDDASWVRVLQSAWVRLPDREMVGLALRQAGRGSIEERVIEGLSAGPMSLAPALQARLDRLFAAVHGLRARALTRPASEILSMALNSSGLLAYQDARSRRLDPDGSRSLAALQDLHRLVLGAERGGRWVGLGELLQRVDVIEAGSGRAEPPSVGLQDMVTLSTIHRAKGLEWPLVVLADCRPFHQQGRPQVLWDRGQGAVLLSRVGGKATQAAERWKSSPDASVSAEEYRRLAYVAMTRARDLLLVTTTRSGVKGGAADLAELTEMLWAGSEAKSEYDQLAQALARRESWIAELPGFPLDVRLPWCDSEQARPFVVPAEGLAEVDGDGLEVAGLDRRWEVLASRPASWADGRLDAPQQLSFSALQTLDQCPRQFWFQYVARFERPQLSDETSDSEDDGGSPDEAPPSRQRALQLGSVLHAVLESAHRGHPGRAPLPDELLASLDQMGASLPPEQRAAGAEMLSRYAGLAVAALPSVAVELQFRWNSWAAPELAPLVGAIDRVARLGDGGVMVVDYKTNRELGAAGLETYAHQLRLYVAAIAAGLLGAPVRAEAALLMLRSGDLLQVDCSQEAVQSTLAWAAERAQVAGAPELLTGLGHPDRPCAQCAFRQLCAERREPATGRALPA
jgi:DNA helicase-2/ATP-dependent DNA helicase PcrA